jgi:hypothetical protein
MESRQEINQKLRGRPLAVENQSAVKRDRSKRHGGCNSMMAVSSLGFTSSQGAAERLGFLRRVCWEEGYLMPLYYIGDTNPALVPRLQGCQQKSRIESFPS